MEPKTSIMGRPKKFDPPRNLVVLIDESLHAKLDRAAKSQDVTKSDLVRPLLEQAVTRTKRPRRWEKRK
jgi:hypothetical protein